MQNCKSRIKLVFEQHFGVKPTNSAILRIFEFENIFVVRQNFAFYTSSTLQTSAKLLTLRDGWKKNYNKGDGKDLIACICVIKHTVHLMMDLYFQVIKCNFSIHNMCICINRFLSLSHSLSLSLYVNLTCISCTSSFR